MGKQKTRRLAKITAFNNRRVDFRPVRCYTGGMSDMLFYVLLAVSVLVIVFLLNWFIKWKAYGRTEAAQRKAEEARRKAAMKGLIVTCPLCNSRLMPGEELVSRVYRPMDVPDQLCTINGCPHCYPAPEPGIRRVCPVCGKTVPLKDAHLIARLFNYKDGKKHVIVTGCTECCKHSPR